MNLLEQHPEVLSAPEASASRPATTDDDFEVVTQVRGREVSCRIVGGALEGDAELIARVARVLPSPRDVDSSALLRVVYDVVGSPVQLRRPPIC